MREVIIAVNCDACRTAFKEASEGNNRVVFTIRNQQKEMDLCNDCLGGSFLQEARPVTGKPDKPFGCHCGKRFDSQRGLSAHQTRQAHD